MARRAFTLIELLVVISIIALLSSVVLAALNSAREKGRLGAAKYFASQMEHAESDYAAGIWDFDECSGTSAADRSGYGNNGTLTAAWSTDTPNGRGCSLYFDGSGVSMTTPQNSSLDITSSITLSVWYKKDVGVGTNRWLIDKGPVNSSYAMFIEGGLKMRLQKPAQQDCIATEPSEGVWHHAVSTYDGSNINIYVDGALVKTCAGTGSINTTTTGIRVGAFEGGGYPFRGYIDMPRVYAKTLTASEVQKLYAAEKPRHEMASI